MARLCFLALPFARPRFLTFPIWKCVCVLVRVCLFPLRSRTDRPKYLFFCESLKVSEEVSRQLASMPHGCDAKKHFRAMIFQRILGLTRPTASPKRTPRAAQTRRKRSRRQKSSSMGVSGTQAVRSPASMACHDQRTNQCSAATKGMDSSKGPGHLQR